MSRFKDAERDSLTGALSSSGLAEHVANAIEAAGAGERVAVVLVAFDGLRELGERSGNLVTDQILRELARRIRETIREGDDVGRHDHHEFVIVFRRLGGRLEMLALVSRLRIALAEPIKAGPNVYRPVVNYGLGQPPADGATQAALVGVAEQALLAMRDQTRETMKRDAVERVAAARAAVATAAANVTAAEHAVRDADSALAEAKKLLAEAKASVSAAREEAAALGVPVQPMSGPR